MNFVDSTGEIGLLAVLVGVCLFVGVLLIPSSEQQEPTEDQIEAAQDAAERASYTVRDNDDGKSPTVDIHIDTADAIANVDDFAETEFFERLYDLSLEKADKSGIPKDNLMTVFHIWWEYKLHEFAYYLGIENAITTDLNVEETPWSMFKRAIGW